MSGIAKLCSAKVAIRGPSKGRLRIRWGPVKYCSRLKQLGEDTGSYRAILPFYSKVAVVNNHLPGSMTRGQRYEVAALRPRRDSSQIQGRQCSKNTPEKGTSSALQPPQSTHPPRIATTHEGHFQSYTIDRKHIPHKLSQ